MQNKVFVLLLSHVHFIRHIQRGTVGLLRQLLVGRELPC